MRTSGREVRRAIRVVIGVLGAIASVPASPASPCRVVLEYDHRADRWNLPGNTCGATLELDFKGVPTIYAKKHAEVTLRIVGTNPLLFGLGEFDVKQADIEGLTKLQDLASAIGAALAEQIENSIIKEPSAGTEAERGSSVKALLDDARHVACLLAALQAERYQALALVQEAAFGNEAAGWTPSQARCPGGPGGAEASQPIVPATYFTAFDVLANDYVIAVSQPSGAVERKALSAAAALLAKRDDVIDPLAAVADVDRRLGVERAGLHPGASYPLSSAAMLAWTPNPQEQRWDKTETYTFKIRKNSPLESKVQSPLHAEVTRSFVTAPRTGSLLGVGVGVIYTPLTAPKWGLVNDPDDGTQKVVTKTDEDTRAGKFALFGTYRFLQHALPSTRNDVVKPGVEFGAGLDVDNAAFFLGVSVEIARYLRIGYGRTLQRVKVPRGKADGDLVPASVTDLPLESENASDWYASVTLALDPLVFFKKK